MHLTKLITNSNFIIRRLQTKFYCSLYNATVSSNLTLHSRCFQTWTKVLPRQIPHIYEFIDKRNVFLWSTNFTRNPYGSRYFSAKSTDDEKSPEDENFNTQLPATLAVPEVWPHVPVIAISRNIVFPRFIKLIEVFFLLFFIAFIIIFIIKCVLFADNKSCVN